MAVIGEAFIDVKPKTDGFEQEAKKGVTGGLDKVAKVAAVTFGTALAVGAAGHFVAEFVRAGAESAKISRVTDAIIKSTGGAAGLAADQVGDLANSLSNLTGVDDEAIQSAENIILTFTNIRNAAGEGNDIFNQTAQAALDMATVLGGDASSAAQQLGKALNDPIDGVTKLARAGVTFTDQQKDQIKTLQASGDILGAQKIILGEVQREFGGAAAAAADPFQTLSVIIDNLKEAIGIGLIPILGPAAQALGDFIAKATPGLASGLTSALRILGGVITTIVVPGVGKFIDAVGRVRDALDPVISGIATFVSDHLPKLTAGLQANGPLLQNLATDAVAVATGVGAIAAALAAVGGGASIVGPITNVVGGLIGALGPLLVTPVGLVAIAIAAVGTAAVVAYQKFKPFRDLVDNVASFFVDLAGTIRDDVIPAVVAAASSIGSTLQPVFDGVARAAQVVAPVIAAVFSRIGEVIGSIVSNAGDITGAVTDAFSNIGVTVTAAATAIADTLAPVISFVQGLWQKYGDEVTGILVGFRDIAVAVFGRVVALLGIVGAQLSNAAQTIAQVVGPAFDVLRAAVEITVAQLAPIVTGLLQGIQIAFQTFISVVGPAWSVLWNLVSDVVSNVIGPISDAIEGVLGVIQGFVDIIAGLFTGDFARAWEGVQEIVGGAIEFVTAQIGFLVGFLEGVFANIVDIISLPFVTAWTIIQGAVEAGVTAVQALFQSIIDFLGAVWANITTLITAPVDAAIAIITGILNTIVGLFGALPGQVTSALSSFAGTLASAATTALEAMSGAVTTGIDAVVGFFEGLPGRAAGALATMGTTVGGAIITAFSTIYQFVQSGIDAVVGFFAALPGRAAAALGDIGSKVGQAIANGLRAAWNFAAGVWNSTLGGIGFSIPDWVPGIGGKGFSVPNLPTLQVGGIIPGTGPFPAILHGGEIVLNARQQSELLMAIAQGQAVPNTGAGQTIINMQASFVNQGTIVGVEDFTSMLADFGDQVADTVAARTLAVTR